MISKLLAELLLFCTKSVGGLEMGAIRLALVTAGLIHFLYDGHLARVRWMQYMQQMTGVIMSEL